MKSLAVSLALLTLVSGASGDDKSRYDFRDTPQYRGLREADRNSLDTVDRDLTLLTGALERYADDQGDTAPKSLADLVPRYLKELPKDPFATKESAAEKDIGAYTASLDGLGYRYRQGIKRSWIVMSVGLPDFPYLAERGNVGLYLPKGLWLSGRQLVPVDE